MKKGLVILLTVVLAMAGCVQQSALQAAIVNSLELDSFESVQKIQFNTNFDVEDSTLLNALSDGIVLETKQKSESEAHVHIRVHSVQEGANDTVMNDGDENQGFPAVDLFVDGETLYLTSAADDAYLVFDEGEGGEVNEGTLQALKEGLTDYLQTFAFDFSQVKVDKDQEVTLANGETVTTERVVLDLDLDEAHALLNYVINHVQESEALLEALVSLTDTDIASLIEELVIDSGTIQEWAEEGVEAQLQLSFFISEQQLVHQEIDLEVTIPEHLVPEFELDENLTFQLKVEESIFNHNGEVQFERPEKETVSVEELQEQSELLDKFAENSPIQWLAFLLFDDNWFPEELYFADVAEEHWAFEAILTLRSYGIIDGYGDNTYRPSQSITRAEFARLMVEFLDLTDEDVELTFKDADKIPAWAQGYMQTAVAYGLIEGYEDQTVRPQGKINRSEMIAIMVRGLGLPMEEDVEMHYTDQDKFAAWAVPYIKTGTAYGLVQGHADLSFGPFDETTRAQAAMVLFNVLNNGEIDYSEVLAERSDEESNESEAREEEEEEEEKENSETVEDSEDLEDSEAAENADAVEGSEDGEDVNSEEEEDANKEETVEVTVEQSIGQSVEQSAEVSASTK